MSDLGRVLAELDGLRLADADWAEIASALLSVQRASDDDSERDAVAALSAATFEAKVHRRFRGGRASPGLPPTKQTTVLPYVGAVCALTLFGIGALLGGGLILVGIGLLSLGVFAVAFAGSNVAHRTPTDDTPRVELVPMPTSVHELVSQLSN